MPRSSRSWDAPEAAVCATCALVERHVGIAIEEIIDAQRLAWLMSDDATGYISVEVDEFPELSDPSRHQSHGRERKL